MNRLKKHKLNELYDISSGISTKPEQYGVGSPFLSFRTIFNNYFIPEELSEFMNTNESEQKAYSIKKGDVFLTRTSETLDELAMSCVALKDYPNATFSGFAKRLRPTQNDITYDKFMGFFLRSKYFRKIIDNNAIMTLRASFNEKIFSYLNIELPEYEEQVKIGNLLHLLEEKIELNKKVNIELEKLAKTLYDYWFVQFDFPDGNNRPYKSSGGKMIFDEKLKRNIPFGWSVNNVKSCIKHINTGLNPRNNFILNNGDIKYITVKNLTTHGCIDFSNCDTIDEFAQKIVHKRSDISKGDILFASIAPLGRCYLIQEEPQTWDINESVFSIRPQNNIPSEYLYMFLMSETFVKKAENSSTGSVFAGIRIKTLEGMLLVIPDNKILQLFKEKISKILLQKHIKEYENQELTTIRDFLLPMLMNGQVTIQG